MPRIRLLADADEVEFFLHGIPFLSCILQDFLAQATASITSILGNLPKPAVPTVKAGDPVNNALLSVAKLLRRADKILQPKTM